MGAGELAQSLRKQRLLPPQRLAAGASSGPPGQPRKESIMRVQCPAARAALLALLALTPLGLGGQPEEVGAPENDKQVMASKAEQRAAATSTNFRKQLGLPFASLATLGGRIDAARRAGDPVALAHAASELAVAEKVSGKKADLTSAAVLKEAAELAKLRRQAAELKATLYVADQIANEQALITELKNQIASAEQSTRQETEAIRQNQAPKAGPRTVLVNNHTTQWVNLVIDGYPWTYIGPGQSQSVVIQQKWNPMVLRAYGNDDVTQWGPRFIWGTFTTYTWNLQ
jgi:hypothetical protein